MSVSTHLCQTDTATCGACCGLFNFRDHSREAIAKELSRHTEQLRDTPTTKEAFAKRAAEIKSTAPPSLFPLVRVCPLLGFLDEGKTRVGCLAHPLRIGVDLRDCGVYTSEICETFTCPSFIWLDDDVAELIRVACPDWYAYGLVITDVEFVRAVLSLIVEEVARPVSARELQAKALAEVTALLNLKSSAPGRAQDGRIFGRFEDSGTEDPKMRIIDYPQLGAASSREDLIVLCLGYDPKTNAELAAARSLVATHITAIARALTASATSAA